MNTYVDVRSIGIPIRQPRALVLLLMLAAPLAVHAQGTPESGGGGYFGAPVLSYTSLGSQGAFMLGGRGGWILTPSFTLGGGLYGTITEVDAQPGSVSDAPGPLDIKLEIFALELEYVVRPAVPLHFTLGGRLGGAATRYARDGTNDQHGETDFLWLVEPAVGLEQTFSRRLRLHLGLGYRLIGGAEQEGLEREDLQGPAVALSVKVGRFP